MSALEDGILRLLEPNKAAAMMTMLEQAFDTKLKLGRNSFSSCLQLEEPQSDDIAYRRFKVYNKILQLIQSDTP